MFVQTTTNLGWECPKCGNCYAPTVERCTSCGNEYYQHWTTTDVVTLNCTCYEGGTANGTCPVHIHFGRPTTTITSSSVPENEAEYEGEFGTLTKEPPGCGCSCKEGPCPRKAKSLYREGIGENDD